MHFREHAQLDLIVWLWTNGYENARN